MSLTCEHPGKTGCDTPSTVAALKGSDRSLCPLPVLVLWPSSALRSSRAEAWLNMAELEGMDPKALANRDSSSKTSSS
jgi:hypothetical protein